MTVKSSAQERLELLRKKFGDIEGADDELVFCEKGEFSLWKYDVRAFNS